MKNNYCKILVAFFSILFLLPSKALAQETETLSPEKVATETSISKLVKVNNDFLINELYEKATPTGKRLVELQPDNANFNFRYGVSLLQSSSNLSEPLSYLKKASENTALKIDMFNAKESKAPIEAIYYYGLALHRVGDIENALVNYQNFINQAGEKHALYKQATLNIKQANNAKSLADNKDIKSVEMLSKNVNSIYADFAPIVSFDGSSLFFTSGRAWKKDKKENQIDPATGSYYEDIYSSFNDDNHWMEAKRLDFCLPTENEASVSISVDERRIYCYNSKSGNGDIYYADFSNGQFNEMKILENKAVNTNNWQPHYFVSLDGKTAFFSSENEPGGFGGLDIYMIKKNNDGTWGSPVNLGSEVNTPYDEDAPFLTFDGKYLYFSSNGDKSIGGFDIFRAEYKNGKFTNVENLGYPINSTYDDLYYSVTADGLTAFISSFRKDGIGDLDIYQLNYAENKSVISLLKDRIYLTDGSGTIPENIEMKLRCLNCDNEFTNALLPRIRDGRFLANLQKCKEYELTYINTTTNKEIAVQKFNTNCEENYEEIEKELGIDVDKDGNITASRLYAFKGSVFDKETNKKMGGVKIEIQDQKGKTIYTLETKEDGTFVSKDFSGLKLDNDYTYKVIVSKADYITISKDITFKADYEHFINIDPIGIEKNKVGKDLGKVIVLNTIYYDLNSSYLRKDAKVELNKVVEAMNLNPNMVIELRSHTDCRESETYNMWLSDRRAVRAADYIKARIKNGNARISGKGYGESELLNKCGCDVTDNSGCSEEQHQLNRRTEFIITKE